MRQKQNMIKENALILFNLDLLYFDFINAYHSGFSA